ncbi:TIGR00282 family metallophosphoesterase [Mycoplasma sp. Mirounga ES2805-ORL]|uniref:TIGR00282 family metallophosphoesterase n=1 Tax=Mycoplasma sp. Mirounga ES2805-ORL TaxID=754514 RepID=UPI00197BDDE1|nr:TIGR00282 family metallophosphoesterase [Mycoplasma sp. Mirounga ES2805-ORL]QSF13644.1 YmdB family metallophosphoesterase [Mycoplasma sp. Mirounga ES2805-ORL]
MNKQIKVLFIGDIFGAPGVKIVKKYLEKIKNDYSVDFVIAQAENVSGRKGFNKKDYATLKNIGINAFTIGNHVWANEEILSFISNSDIIRPLNINKGYPGEGSRIFNINNSTTIRVTSLMGITFNKLMKPWKEESAESFFDAIDGVLKYGEKTDFSFVDFHGETTSEKNVFALYVDGKIDAVCGTHTHVQTNDASILPNKTLFISDVGMCGPYNSAIGANYQEVYEHMRYGAMVKFKVSDNKCKINAVVLTMNTENKENNSIELINIKEK